MYNDLQIKLFTAVLRYANARGDLLSLFLLMFMVARVCQFCKKFFTDLGELGEEICDIFYGYAHRDCAG